MLTRLTLTCLTLFCATTATVTAESAKKKESHSNVLAFDRGGKIKASKVAFSAKNGNSCQHVAKYDNGQIVTRIGGISLGSEGMSIKLAGEQSVTMHDLTGQVCFNSTSNEWEVQDSGVVHHHNGFDVQTTKKGQFVLIR